MACKAPDVRRRISFVAIYTEQDHGRIIFYTVMDLSDGRIFADERSSRDESRDVRSNTSAEKQGSWSSSRGITTS